MRKKLLLGGVSALLCITFILYFFTFTTSDANNLYLTVDYENENGWEITGIENGEEIPLTASQAIQHTETVYLRREVPENWASYSRINLDTGRAVLLFVDDELVFSNHTTSLEKPGELALMRQTMNQPFSLVLSYQPAWQGKTITLVTRLYENKPYGSIGFELINDHVFLLQHEAWVNQKALPGMMFGVFSLILLGLFLFEFFTKKKGYPILFLAISSILQTLCYMSVLDANPLPIDHDFATALYFLFPLLYFGTKLKRNKKMYFILILSSWGIYFLSYVAVFILQLPLPYYFDKTELLCFIPVGISLYYCLKDRRSNPFLQHFLSLSGLFCIGYTLLFLITKTLNIALSEIILTYFKEAQNLYFRPLLFWVFTTILLILFILSVHDLLQERIQGAEQVERMRSEKAMLNLQIDSAKDQLGSLRIANEQTRIYRHDMRHHLSLLSSYIMDGDINKAKEYIHATEANIESVTPVRYCENETVNLILSAFKTKAQQADVPLSITAELPLTLALPDTILCAVLSNGLENAIIASGFVPEKDRNVRVICKLNHNKLLIFIENTCVGKIEFINGLPKTDKVGHGFGTKSILAMAKKQNGDCLYEAQEGIFTLRVVLPLNS